MSFTALDCILAEIRAERLTHAARGYDAEHDRQHGVRALVGLAGGYAALGDRPALIAAASLIAAAIELGDAEMAA